MDVQRFMALVVGTDEVHRRLWASQDEIGKHT